MNIIAFRADGGSRIGMGHIMRCLALANSFPDDVEVWFITKDNKKVVELINQSNFKVITINGNLNIKEEIELVKKIIKEKDIDILITDSYDINQDYLLKISDTVKRLVSIHDLNPFSSPADIVINGNIFAPKLDYRSYYGKTKFLLGTDYTLLREEFKELPDKKIHQQVKNILVTVGGADILNLIPKIIRAFKLNEKKWHNEGLVINMVIGPAFTNLKVIEQEIEKSKLRINLKFNVKKMSDLMVNSDLAISAGGSTLYELAATGIPAVVLLQADNQILLAEEMEKRGIIINLGMGDQIKAEMITEKINYLINDFELRKRMSREGQKLVDGNGASRCVEEIL